jgi:hypothetical protein
MATKKGAHGPPVGTTHPTPSTIRTLSTMPPEVVVEAFESLDSLRTAINLASTCQTFWLLYKRLQATICLQILPSDPRFKLKYQPADRSAKLYAKAFALFFGPDTETSPIGGAAILYSEAFTGLRKAVTRTTDRGRAK